MRVAWRRSVPTDGTGEWVGAEWRCGVGEAQAQAEQQLIDGQADVQEDGAALTNEPATPTDFDKPAKDKPAEKKTSRKTSRKTSKKTAKRTAERTAEKVSTEPTAPLTILPPLPERRDRSFMRSVVVDLVRNAIKRSGTTQEQVARAMSLDEGCDSRHAGTIASRTVRSWCERSNTQQIPADRLLRFLVWGPGLSEEAHRQMLTELLELGGYEVVPVIGLEVDVSADDEALAVQAGELMAVLGEFAREAVEACDASGQGGTAITPGEAAEALEHVIKLRRMATETERALRRMKEGGEG